MDRAQVILMKKHRLQLSSRKQRYKTQKAGASPDQEEKENTDAIKETSQRDQEVVWNERCPPSLLLSEFK